MTNHITKEPIWVNDHVVYGVHCRQLAEHGGGDGIRDQALLESALNKPKNLYHYSTSKPDLAALAASYAYGICRDHPFVDGNKRTALIICQLFLRLNGMSLNTAASEKYQTTMTLAAGEMTEETLSRWINPYISMTAP